MSQNDTTAGVAADDGGSEDAGEQLTVLFAYDGAGHLEPADHGLRLAEGPELDFYGLGLREGDYEVTIVVRGRPGQRRGPLQPGPGLPARFGRTRPALDGGDSV